MNNEEKERILYPLPFIEIVARKENTKRRKSNIQPKGEKGRINVHLQFKRAGKLTNKSKELHVNVTLKPKIVDLDSFQKGTVVQKVPSKTAVKFQFCASFTKKCWSSRRV